MIEYQTVIHVSHMTPMTSQAADAYNLQRQIDLLLNHLTLQDAAFRPVFGHAMPIAFLVEFIDITIKL